MTGQWWGKIQKKNPEIRKCKVYHPIQVMDFGKKLGLSLLNFVRRLPWVKLQVAAQKKKDIAPPSKVATLGPASTMTQVSPSPHMLISFNHLPRDLTSEKSSWVHSLLSSHVRLVLPQPPYVSFHNTRILFFETCLVGCVFSLSFPSSSSHFDVVRNCPITKFLSRAIISFKAALQPYA